MSMHILESCPLFGYMSLTDFIVLHWIHFCQSACDSFSYFVVCLLILLMTYFDFTFLYFFNLFIETRSLSWTWLALNSQRSGCLCLPNTGTKRPVSLCLDHFLSLNLPFLFTGNVYLVCAKTSLSTPKLLFSSPCLIVLVAMFVLSSILK